MSMRLVARAPAKVILFGEHYVVYGAPGLVAAIEPYNEIEMEAEEVEGPLAGFEYHSTAKENDINVHLADKSSVKTHPYAALYQKLAARFRPLQRLRIHAQVKCAWPLKGVGNSSSLGAALGAGLRTMAGEKKIIPAEAFDDAQTADEVAHGGGMPSGIDAAAAAYGGVLEFKKNFQKPLAPKIEPLKLAPMRGVGFILVDTYAADGRRGSTTEQISAFAAASNITKNPDEMGEEERDAVSAPYESLYLHARQALEKGEWGTVGHLMDENHQMVSDKGVSSPGIEKAAAICKSFGALGAKLSGAGGPGGTVIALVEKERIPVVQDALEAGGFEAYPFKLASKGAQVEKLGKTGKIGAKPRAE